MARQADIQYVRYYTQGSAAPKVEPVLQEDTFYFPKIHKHRRKRLYVDPFALIGSLVALGMLLSMIFGLGELKSARQETLQMEQHIAQLAGENKTLETKLEEGYDLDAVQKTAEALGMVPKAQVPSVPLTVQIPEMEVVEEPDIWQRIGAFFADLFA